MQYVYSSPIGKLGIISDGDFITGIRFEEDIEGETDGTCEAIDICVQQLDEYFAGRRRFFDLPLYMKGTDFQKTAWDALLQIEYGGTATYGHIAAKIGKPKACRAVGGANNKNPIPVIVPCHRVVGANGKMVGYAGGLWRKEWLLAHELEDVYT